VASLLPGVPIWRAVRCCTKICTPYTVRTCKVAESYEYGTSMVRCTAEVRITAWSRQVLSGQLALYSVPYVVPAVPARS
jgi:hypothetical protein